ncbi:DUF4062 domain-containing protein [Saccharothrix xinjiangensis]|uniref:DUF4062 domain-containing protein n=1 Tax=Saccharothrix xinjiangensis TaxID=204798 RepID=A0ABV9Y4W2_9PSEU
MAGVHVSSTYQDLKEHREAVRNAVRRMGHVDVATEHYAAADDRPLDRCLADVRGAVRRASAQVLEREWSGDEEVFAALLRRLRTEHGRPEARSPGFTRHVRADQ